jgi:Leucine-rich repeat (LRR) protein
MSIYNSQVDNTTFSQLPHNVEILILRRCFIDTTKLMGINGGNLRVVELPYCELREIPSIQSSHLHKLNVSHNKIEEISMVPCSKTLRVLDIRNNRISKFT